MSTDRAVTRREVPAPSSWGMGDGQAIPWEYAPAPEARDMVKLRERYGLFIDGRDVEASDGGTFTSVDPSTELPLALVSKATAEDVDRAVRAAKRAGRRAWTDLPGRERAKYLFRIARILQERSREFAVLESMDSGKPIKESRDVDVPLAAAHFWYYAGWADKLEYAFPGRLARPARRRPARAPIPLNFPCSMLSRRSRRALRREHAVAEQHRRFVRPRRSASVSACMATSERAALAEKRASVAPTDAACGSVKTTRGTDS